MALNSSGPISLGGAIAGQSINLEIGQAATATTSLNATNVRTLAQVTTPNSTIIMPTNFYGKSNYTPTTQLFTSSGTATVPAGTGRVVFTVWGAGGGGGCGNTPVEGNEGASQRGQSGSAGGQSSANGAIGNGGGGGSNGNSGGAGGTASGGNTNTSGNAGANSTQYIAYYDGESGAPVYQYYGSAGGGSPAVINASYGYGGNGYNNSPSGGGGGGGGGGGYSKKTITTGIAGTYAIVVGAGGARGLNPSAQPPSNIFTTNGASGVVIVEYFAS